MKSGLIIKNSDYERDSSPHGNRGLTFAFLKIREKLAII
jgi:hypothetical protein